jgi:hypothetical protein
MSELSSYEPSLFVRSSDSIFRDVAHMAWNIKLVRKDYVAGSEVCTLGFVDLQLLALVFES